MRLRNDIYVRIKITYPNIYSRVMFLPKHACFGSKSEHWGDRLECLPQNLIFSKLHCHSAYKNGEVDGGKLEIKEKQDLLKKTSCYNTSEPLYDSHSNKKSTTYPLKLKNNLYSVDQIKNERKQMNIIICTATEKEDDAIDEYAAEQKIKHSAISMGEGVYRTLGQIGNANVYWVRSSMGSGGTSGSGFTTDSAIRDIKPKYVISCGLCFGANSEKQDIGDVLCSTWVRNYEPGRRGEDIFIPRGDRTPASSVLLQAFRTWRMDRKDLTLREGGFLSGEKVVDDPEFKKHLFKIEPEAIGGDMEGAGITSACQRRGIDWIVIKSICDWGENKHNSDQPASARNAFDFTFSLIEAALLPNK